MPFSRSFHGVFKKDVKQLGCETRRMWNKEGGRDVSMDGKVNPVLVKSWYYNLPLMMEKITLFLTYQLYWFEYCKIYVKRWKKNEKKKKKIIRSKFLRSVKEKLHWLLFNKKCPRSIKTFTYLPKRCSHHEAMI